MAQRRAYDAERRRLSPWRKLYSTARWRRTREDQLEREPLCRMCLDERPERVTAATVCDHVNPHRGDLVAFWSGPFQSLCDPCHSSKKQREEQGSQG